MFGFRYGGRVLNNGHIRKSLAVGTSSCNQNNGENFNAIGALPLRKAPRGQAARLKALCRCSEPVMEKKGV